MGAIEVKAFLSYLTSEHHVSVTSPNSKMALAQFLLMYQW
ncbi:hypothetical protein ACO0LM_06110 [Undibacterium sp. Di26W]